MIVGTCFPGDDNDTLKWVQHDLYGTLLAKMVLACRGRYLAAVRLAGVQTELADRIRDLGPFDHHILQEAHDTIAAHFRKTFDPSGQMPLPFDGMSYREHLGCRWTQFYCSEVVRLTEYDDYVISVLTAVGYQNTDRGYAAEDQLVSLLKSEYDLWS